MHWGRGSKMHFWFSHFCAPKYVKMRFLSRLNVLVVFIKSYIKQQFSSFLPFNILSKSLTGLPSGGRGQRFESSRAGHFNDVHSSQNWPTSLNPFRSNDLALGVMRTSCSTWSESKRYVKQGASFCDLTLQDGPFSLLTCSLGVWKTRYLLWMAIFISITF